MFDFISQWPDAESIVDWLVTSGVLILLILLLSIIGIGLLSFISRIVARRIKSLDDTVDSQLDRRIETLRQVINATGVAIILATALLMILNALNIDIGPVVASIGVVGLALGLGAQTLVKDVIGGFFILLEDQYHVGDTVELSGRIGTVEEITLRITQLRDFQGYIHFIPNGEVRVVTNRARDWSRAVVDINVPFDEDVQNVIALLEEIGRQASEDEIRSLLKEVPTVTGIEGLDGGNVSLRLIVKTVPNEQFEVQRYFRQQIQEQFADRGLRIGFPRQEISVRQSGKIFQSD